jgi:FkbM family methyltransferase
MIDRTHNSQAVRRWFAARGDETLRLDYPLTPDSYVLDIGGFKGNFAEQISNKFKCTIHIFEPMVKYAAHIAHRCKDNNKVFVHPVGVGGKSEDIIIYIPDGADEATMHPGNSNIAGKEEIKVIDIVDVFKDLEIDHFDLMKLNIEGAEFDLLDRLIAKKLHKKVTDIQIQFHKIDENSEERRSKLQKKLSKTHECTYDYEFVWENWKLK